jgi:hypothetical protein
MHIMSSVESLFENFDVNDNFLICGNYNLPDIYWDLDLSDGRLLLLYVGAGLNTG